MNIWDYLLILTVIIWLIAAICYIIQGKKKGRGCCGSCSGCGSCGQCGLNTGVGCHENTGSCGKLPGNNPDRK